MKTLFAVLAVMILIGCSIHPSDWKKCERICELNGGTRELKIEGKSLLKWDVMYKCFCNNGVEIDLYFIKENNQ